ncbi:Outer membrane protein OmpA [Methylobacillus rhizosphaerae]|uniref:Outer membrane protein OmpA n=1 Tax=Methylobacillus rhizosphaerae TaxID=551994 RepID=A0A238YAT6_9PROT|nr:OmpA family protein [Methylobacillus rhizosphaerae]SNR68237.1 Outer membrane protein OmpA [Methylobacillus rhizosphaerae]
MKQTTESCTWVVRMLLAGLVSASLVACGSLSKNIAEDGSTAEELVWPDLDDTSLLKKDGSYPTPETLSLLQPGLTKSQVQGLLEQPHFAEKIWGVREWNYLFHLRDTPTANTFHICQLKVLFDKDGKAGSYYWKPEGCAQPAAEPPAPEPAPVPVPVPVPPAPEPVVRTLSSEVLFAFDSATLSPKGQAALAELAADIQRGTDSSAPVAVAAYTDRLGSDSYNQRLSQARANSVRSFFVTQGINSSRITATGKGEQNPVSNCSDKLPRAELIACLAPDRRVEVTTTQTVLESPN